jgi:hypothetical protein
MKTHSVCFAKASISSIGAIIRLLVRKAAKLAVYDAIIINEKNHHAPIKTRVESERGP